MAEGKAGFHNNRVLGKSECGKLDKFSVQSHQPPKQPPENTTYIIAPHIRSKEPDCPECGSQKLWKDGFRYIRGNGQTQRWLCRACGYRFSENGTSKPLQKTSSWSINTASAIPSNRQVCELLTEGSKNLATVDTTQQTKEKAAGATATDPATIKGKIIELGVRMLNNGRPESSVEATINILKMLSKRTKNFFDPEDIKATIAKQPWAPSTKKRAVWAYTHFLEMQGLTWEMPKYKVSNTLPFVPLEEEVDQLIAALGKKNSIFTQTVKETGARVGEAKRLKWIDINKGSGTITIRSPEKGSNPRVLDVTTNLIERLHQLPENSEYVFPTYLRNFRNFYVTFGRQKKRIAQKLSNPRILQITLHKLRHLKGTMEYHKTRDPFYVRDLLGHKQVKTTEIYVHLEHAIFRTKNDEFTVRVARTPEEIQTLLEVGFEFVVQKDGLLFFRKRK